MKFELTNQYEKISDIEIINDLRAVANILGKKSLKQRDYCRENGSKYIYTTATKRFGNWKKALEKAGLSTENSIHGNDYDTKKIDESELLNDIIRVSNELNNLKITAAEYDKYGKWSSVTICKRFKTWNKAKEKAGLKITHTNATTEEFLKNILDLWTIFGRQPKSSEVIAPNSKYHISSYYNKFGTWRIALEEFIKYMNLNIDDNLEKLESETKEIIELTGEINSIKKIKKEIKIKRTTRNINWRLRWYVLKRDNFTCKKCGRSPAKEQNVILHIDHIIPWSKDGETILENLETLCETCNIGKSNLI